MHLDGKTYDKQWDDTGFIWSKYEQMTIFADKASPAVLNGSAAHDALPNLLQGFVSHNKGSWVVRGCSGSEAMHGVGMLEAATTKTC